jgi:8-oxo-dGTP pyrophosphatase MutT (NUDIX family)
MKTKPKNIGNVTLVLDTASHANRRLLLVLKAPKDKADAKRKRKRVGAGRWVPPGGGTEPFDKSQKHAAQRELREETKLRFPLKVFRKVGVLEGYNGSADELLWLVHLYLIVVNGIKQRIVPGHKLLESRWFPISRLPFRQMLTGDRDWIPRIINGEKLVIKIVFDKDESNVKSKAVKPIRSFN